MLTVTVKADGVYTCVPINTVGTGHNATISVTAVGKSKEDAALLISICMLFNPFTPRVSYGDI